MTKKILIDEAVVKQALGALEKTHYRIIDAGLLDQKLLNENFTAATNLREALEVNNKGVNALTEQPAQQEPCHRSRSSKNWEEDGMSREAIIRMAIEAQIDCELPDVEVTYKSPWFSCTVEELERFFQSAYELGVTDAFIAGFICAGGDAVEAKSQAAQFVSCTNAGREGRLP